MSFYEAGSRALATEILVRPEERGDGGGSSEVVGEVLEIDDVEDEGGETCEPCADVERHGPQEDRRKLRGLLDPRKPSKQEVDEHELTHLN